MNKGSGNMVYPTWFLQTRLVSAVEVSKKTSIFLSHTLSPLAPRCSSTWKVEGPAGARYFPSHCQLTPSFPFPTHGSRTWLPKPPTVK